VTRVAFHDDQRAIEVLDVNGLQRRVKIFPEVAPLLVEDLHNEHVPFFVAPPPPAPFPPIVIAFVEAILLTLLTLIAIDVLGLTPEFVMGCMIVGAEVLRLSKELDDALMKVWKDATESVSAGRARHDAAWMAWTGGGSAERDASTPSSYGLQPQCSLIPIVVEDDADENERFS